MPDKRANEELCDLLQQTREYARYFGELGVTNVARVEVSGTTIAPSEAANVKPNTPKVAPPVKSTRRSTPTSTVAEQSWRTSAPLRAGPPDSLFAELAPAEISLQSTETLEDIWRDIGDCTRCGLCAGRTQVVNTHGNPKARLMFVGEAPGADEDAQGKPFVGRAGQLLTKMIEAMGMKRDDVIIGNVNRCRPPGNRQPTLEEAAICRPFLFREIATVQPEVIVVMGNTALRNLLEVREGITRVRGQFQDFRGIKVMPTFHPAYLLRDPSKKRETWEDLKKVMDYLDSHARPAANN
jgi:uracil-DNA glycosylase family 4